MDIRLRDLFLLVLGSMSGGLQANRIPAFLIVTCIKGIDFSSCHRSLVSSVGVNRIDLVQTSDAFRLYRVQGSYSDMTRAFISSCNNIRMCRISPDSTEVYTVDVSQHLTANVKLNMHDKSIRLFATSMVFRQTFVDAHAHTVNNRQINNQKVAFKRKRALRIPVLFGEDFIGKNK